MPHRIAAEQVTMQATRATLFSQISLPPPQFKPGVGGHTCTNSRAQVGQGRVKGPLQTEILPWKFWGQVEESGNSGRNTREARRWPPSRKAPLPWSLGQRRSWCSSDTHCWLHSRLWETPEEEFAPAGARIPIRVAAGMSALPTPGCL